MFKDPYIGLRKSPVHSTVLPKYGRYRPAAFLGGLLCSCERSGHSRSCSPSLFYVAPRRAALQHKAKAPGPPPRFSPADVSGALTRSLNMSKAFPKWFPDTQEEARTQRITKQSAPERRDTPN